MLTAPCRHDHHIVNRHTDDLVDALGFDGVSVLHKAGKMDLRTGTGKCSRDGKEDNALARKTLRRRNRVRCPLVVKLEDLCIRNWVAFLNAHALFSSLVSFSDKAPRPLHAQRLARPYVMARWYIE